MLRTTSILVVVFAAAGAAQPVASRTRSSIRIAGTVTLEAVNVQKRCTFSGRTKTLVVATCEQSGTYAGKPGSAGAAYSWRWYLEVGPKGTTTGKAVERGRLSLNFGKLGILRLVTSGRQVPVGALTKDAARARTTGTWKVESGTRALARRQGSGTYAFETSRTGSTTTFQIARVRLVGAVR